MAKEGTAGIWEPTAPAPKVAALILRNRLRESLFHHGLVSTGYGDISIPIALADSDIGQSGASPQELN